MLKLLFGLFFLYLFVKYIIGEQRFKRLKSPITLPGLCHYQYLQQLFYSNLHSGQAWQNLCDEFGSFFHIKFMNKHFYVISDPVIIEEIFNTKSQFFANHNHDLMQPLSNAIGPNNLVSLEGSKWRYHRSVLNPIFATNRNLNLFCETILENTTTVLMYPLSVLTSSHPISLDIMPLFQELIFNIIGPTFLSYKFDFGDGSNPMTQSIGTIMQHVVDMMLFPLSNKLYPICHPQKYYRFSKARQVFRQICDKLIQDKLTKINQTKEANEYKDIIDLMMEGRLSIDEIRDEIILFIFGALETTNTSLGWFMYWIAKHPEIQLKVQRELDNAKKLEYETLFELTYLDFAIKESARITPAATYISKGSPVKEIIKLGEYDIAPNSVIFIPTYTLHHDKKYWVEPEKFNPDRWLNNRAIKNTYLPFGGGPRICLGKRFVEMEMMIILGKLLKEYTFRIDESRPMVQQNQTTIGPKSLCLIVNKRV